MIWGLATAQQQRDRCEGPERYLPIGWGRCDVCRRVVPEDSLRETGGQEIRHAYCAKHMADFLAGTSADTCE